MRRRFYLSLLAAVLPALAAFYPAWVSAKPSAKPDLTFIGVAATAQSVPCTATYTDVSYGATFCTVYSGTIQGPALGKGWQSAMVVIDATRASATDSAPIGCHGMYLNIQYSNGTAAGMQTLYGFGSVCGPDSTPSNFQSGANLTGSGGWAMVDPSNGSGSSVGSFIATFTPEKGTKTGENLVMTFQNTAPSGQ